jgi:hypothetical protein
MCMYKLSKLSWVFFLIPFSFFFYTSASYICYAFVAVDYSAALAKLCDQIEPPDRTSEREYVSGRIRLWEAELC